MESKEFYRKINEYIKSLEKEEIINFVNNIIRKIPESKYEEILCIINSNNLNIDKTEIEQNIKKYKEKFNEIEEKNLYFYAEQYEDYSYGWDDWNTEYTDKDNLEAIIVGAVKYAVKLVNYKEYHYAKEMFDMILKTNYTAFDEEMGETFELSLSELQEYGLISVNVPVLCSYIIYVTYQTSKNKVEDIYNYFKNNPDFRDVSIEDSFKLGSEQLTNIDDFFASWINFLSQVNGDLEYRLLKEALIYTDFKDYRKYINEFTKNQPKIYIDIFEYLEKENRLDELKNLGNQVLKTLNNNQKVGSDITLYLSKIDTKHKESYICSSFVFKPDILNLLRIINNGYYKKHENEIKNKIEKVIHTRSKEIYTLDKDKCSLLYFFSGDFEKFYNENIKHKDSLGWTYSFIKTSVYLWLLLLNNSNKTTKAYSKLLSAVFSDIGYSEKESSFLGNDIYEIWQEWKNNFKLDENIKKKVINWLNEIIEKRVAAILEGNHVKSYYKAALLVVAYDELLLSQNLESKDEYIKYYTNKYSRRSAFKRELNNLL